MRIQPRLSPYHVYLLLLLSPQLVHPSAPEPDTCQWIENTNVCISNEQPACGLYMAPSTLGEGANLGMYAGTAIQADTVIQEEIAIPLLFREFDNPTYFHEIEGGDENKDDGALWYRYIWNGWVADIESYSFDNIQDSRAVFVPGIGCTINSILELNNVQSTTGSTCDTAGLSRSDPGAGAFSPYHGSVTKSTVDIPAGGELFADYGDEWIPDIPGAAITFGGVMDRAEDFLRDDYYPFVQNHAMPHHLLEGLWNFTRDFPHPNPEIFTVLPRNVEWKEIEQTLEEFRNKEVNQLKNRLLIQHAANRSLSPQADPHYMEAASVIRHFIRQLGKRDMEWLQENGRCSDHIRPGKSTIPHAGRGAFATRDLPQGTIVGYAPLVHVGLHGEELYNIPYTVEGEGNTYNKSDLILNYAFGHPNSTILLSPYGSMVNYINHAPTGVANVRVVWPTKELVAHKPDWLNRDLKYIASTVEKIGLSLDYVAVKDIANGEEILMDYGPEWEQAWQDHIASWKPPNDADDYVHSSQWTEVTFRTHQELMTNPYPPNLMTVCIPAFAFDRRKQRHYFAPLDKEYIDRVKCTVLERQEGSSEEEEIYTVELENGDDEDEKGLIRVLDFPRSHIALTDKIMSQDWHLPNTFRHWIGIPDDIFPDSWRNRLEYEE